MNYGGSLFRSGACRSTRRARRRGGSLIEMALTLTILLNLSFGAVEFGYYFFVKNTVSGAAREGVRAAIVATGTDALVDAAVDNVLSAAGLATGNFTIAISPDLNTSPGVGTNITVTVTANWGTIANGFRPLGLIGANKTVSGAAVMRKES